MNTIVHTKLSTFSISSVDCNWSFYSQAITTIFAKMKNMIVLSKEGFLIILCKTRLTTFYGFWYKVGSIFSITIIFYYLKELQFGSIIVTVMWYFFLEWLFTPSCISSWPRPRKYWHTKCYRSKWRSQRGCDRGTEGFPEYRYCRSPHSSCSASFPV